MVLFMIMAVPVGKKERTKEVKKEEGRKEGERGEERERERVNSRTERITRAFSFLLLSLPPSQEGCMHIYTGTHTHTHTPWSEEEVQV